MDDEQDVLDILVRVLTTAGYDVDTASNGLEGLQQVALRDYDLIVTNIRMPVLDGRAFYRQLCALDSHLSQRVIFCTGDIADPATQHFLCATGAPVVFKPFALNDLLEAVSGKLAEQAVPPHPRAMSSPQPEATLVLASES